MFICSIEIVLKLEDLMVIILKILWFRIKVDISDNLGIQGNHNQSAIIFKTWGNGNENEKECMRINSDGIVGIGTSNPIANLDILEHIGY